MTPFGAIYQLVVRRLVTRSRLLVFAAVTAAMVLIGVLIYRRAASPVSTTVEVVASLGLLLVVPLICLVIATPAIGEWLDDETLVYVWLRPIRRRTLAIAPFMAALTVALPMNIVSTGLLAAIGSRFDRDVTIGAVVSSLVATLAYCSLFVMMGAWTKRALVFSFVYVFVWEGLVAQFGPGLARLAIRSYSVSALARITETRQWLDGRQSTSIVFMVGLVVLGGLALTTSILQRKDVP